MSNYIVITTINEPTESIKRFSKTEGHNLIVVGDCKTPLNWKYNNTRFISIQEQSKLGIEMEKHLPLNHYSRKMLGYLIAKKCGAENIIDTDDDNIPYENWSFPNVNGKYDSIQNDGFVNVYELFSDQKIWPRGLPLEYINKKTDYNISNKKCKVGIWQALADIDPDVDAIYRLTLGKECNFKKRTPVVLDKGVISPINSQNTFTCKELFSLLYIPTTVSFRFTDILRGLILQPIAWLYDYHIGFCNASVYQLRNQHDLSSDFESEVPMYKYAKVIPDIVSTIISSNKSINDNLYNSYLQLQKQNIVRLEELKVLEMWLKEF